MKVLIIDDEKRLADAVAQNLRRQNIDVNISYDGEDGLLDALQKYFPIAGMPMAPSTYWPMAHGCAPGEVLKDSEGIQIMKMIGKTVAWLLKCIEAGKAKGVFYPEVPGGEKVYTNFVR